MTTITTVPAVDTGQKRGAIIASVLGWSLDLFDLFILLYVAPVVGAAFFPSDKPTLSLAAVYASFAVTLLMRPVGSAIFGHYADVNGRKRAMIVAMMGVGISTAAFGLLPTIHQVGVLAPVIFLILRLIQGVFVGGVVASTHTIGTESVSPGVRGAMSGLIGGGGAGIGALFASLVYFIASELFPGDAFAAWGWRFMFFCGLLSSLLGLYIMSSLQESPYFQELQKAKAENKAAAPQAPLRSLFSREYRNVFLINLLVTFGGGAGYYITSGYLPTFLKVINKLPYATTSLILIGGSIVAFISAVLVGSLSDRIGRKATFILVGILAIIALPLIYTHMAQTTDISMIVFYALSLAFIGNAVYAPILIFLNERFPTEMRASGTALSWNVGFALGGMMPTFISLMSDAVGNIPHTLAIFAGGIFLIYLIGAFVIPETKGNFK